MTEERRISSGLLPPSTKRAEPKSLIASTRAPQSAPKTEPLTGKVAKAQLNAQVHADLRTEIRAAYRAVARTSEVGSFGDFINGLLRNDLENLREQYNEGQPFTGGDKPLEFTRPIDMD